MNRAAFLLPEARSRTAEAVGRFVQEARILGTSDITLVGTSATRSAVDGPDFVRELGERFQVRAGVLSGESEARLAFLGATVDVPGDAVVVDVGGGSTEIVRWAEDEQVESVSLELGCVRDTERWFSADPPSGAERERLRAHVARVATGIAERFRGAEAMVAVGGTATTLAALRLGLERYHPEAVHLTALSLEDVRSWADRLASLDGRARAALPCMQPGRAEVIVAGCDILLGLMDVLGYSLMFVSERDLLDGVILAM